MKRLLAGMISSAFVLTGCFWDGDISSVKNGVLDFDKSLKVGDAFDNWSQCTERNWSEFKTSNGRKIVQFECKSTKVREFSEAAIKMSPIRFGELTIRPEEMIITFQWMINTNDTFKLSAISRHFKWSDGAETSDRSVNEGLLKKVYDNEIEYDPVSLTTPSGLDLAIRRMSDLSFLRQKGALVTPPTKPVTQQQQQPVAEKKAKASSEEEAGD